LSASKNGENFSRQVLFSSVRVGIYAMENNKTIQWGLRKKKATKKKI
jgi:hypothetical protein